MTLLEIRKKNKMLCLNDIPLASLNDFFSNQTKAMKPNRYIHMDEDSNEKSTIFFRLIIPFCVLK